jgi:hypothetical protein
MRNKEERVRAYAQPAVKRPRVIAVAAIRVRGRWLNTGAVICCADTIPGMREKVVLRAVIEFIARTQLATDVETDSSNTDSNRSPANNSQSRPFFLGGRDFR